MIIEENTPIKNLVGTSKEVDAQLKYMSSSNFEDRRIVIDAMGVLIEDYISPLMKEYELSDKSKDFLLISEITDGKISGLVAGLFDLKLKESMTGLEKPSDKDLKEALEYVDAPIDNFDKRNQFFKCWAAIKAVSTVHSLVNFLKEPLIGQNPARLKGLKEEQETIIKLLNFNLPKGMKYLLKSLLERLKENEAPNE